jgi:hypothetical protein
LKKILTLLKAVEKLQRELVAQTRKNKLAFCCRSLNPLTPKILLLLVPAFAPQRASPDFLSDIAQNGCRAGAI